MRPHFSEGMEAYSQGNFSLSFGGSLERCPTSVEGSPMSPLQWLHETTLTKGYIHHHTRGASFGHLCVSHGPALLSAGR